MIRMVHLLRRKAGVSADAFTRQLRDVHGPLVAGHQVTLGIVRHVQTHPAVGAEAMMEEGSRVRGGTEPAYDAITEYWWKSESDLADALASDTGRAALSAMVDCEAGFVDAAASPLWFAHEYPQVATFAPRAVARHKTGVVRVHFALRPLPGMSTAEAQRYWLTMHGPLVRSHAVARGFVAYTQVHMCETPLADAMRQARGSTAEPYTGHAEAWFERLTPRVGPEAQAATEAAVADERNFIDWQRSTFLVGKELVFVDRDWS